MNIRFWNLRYFLRNPERSKQSLHRSGNTIPKSLSLDRCFVSFLVDDLPLHYYQAELLLFSIENNTNIKREHLLVHCTSRVQRDFLVFLERQGISYRIIDPYLDGKYCNKLTQLSAYRGLPASNIDGVLLLDVDMFFLSDPIVPDKHSFSAKPVDAPNPSLSTLRRIYDAAGLKYPDLIDTDWSIGEGKTFANNFNGGFYYIPSNMVRDVDHSWRKWAEWLYNRKNLFEDPRQAIHIDQVAMALTLSEKQITPVALSTNENYPLHQDRVQLKYYDSSREPTLLHYHRCLTPFGSLDPCTSDDFGVRAANEASKALNEMKKSSFFFLWKKHETRRICRPKDEEALRNRLQKFLQTFSGRVRLILHTGAPKTGTTTLQFFWDREREAMMNEGVLYGKSDGYSMAPKHQWLMNDLKNENFSGFIDKMIESVDGISREGIHTFLLSTEGIYNHWWDLSGEARGFLQLLGDCFDLELWTWLRDPLDFTESLYRQYMKNPRVAGIDCYGRDLTPSQMLDDKWFARHLDYLGFIIEAKEVLGENGILRVFPVKGDVVLQMKEALGLVGDYRPVSRKNEKLSCQLIEVLKILNRKSLPPERKQKLVNRLYEIQEEFGDWLEERPLCEETMVERVHEMVIRQLPVLKEEFGIDLSFPVES